MITHGNLLLSLQLAMGVVFSTAILKMPCISSSPSTVQNAATRSITTPGCINIYRLLDYMQSVLSHTFLQACYPRESEGIILVFSLSRKNVTLLSLGRLQVVCKCQKIVLDCSMTGKGPLN